MPLVNLTREPDSLQGYRLITPANMREALEYLNASGYSGTINCTPTGEWTMGLTSPGQTSAASAHIGDWIVLKNNAAAEVVTAAAFDSLYNVV